MQPSDAFRGTKRFVIDGRLGAGGMGVVHRARDLERDETVALKTMVYLDPEGLLRFKKEFRALADISHPNVVQLYELFSESDQWFFTMELVDGVDLLTWVHSSRTMPPPLHGADLSAGLHPTVLAAPSYFDSLRPGPAEDTRPPSRSCQFGVRDVARLREGFRQLGAGLSAIHAAGKLHRDVKPPNVIVTRSGRVVLLDFGVVTDIADRAGHDVDDSLSGTPAYMAPEQASFMRATAATDWYAVGVVLYEALAGRLPFDGSPPAILFAKQQGEPPPPSAYLEGVPEDLAQLAMDLLQPDPRRRPSGEQVLARLEGARPSSIMTAVEPAFVGRGVQLGVLRSAFAESTAELVVVMLHGRSGMGKSTLAARFLGELAAKQDALVLSGRCYERETVPFKAVDPVIDELRHWLARLAPGDAYALLPPDIGALARVFPVLGDLAGGSDDGVPPHELRRRAFAALRELLGNIAARHRLVVHVDDLQWCDADSVQLLEAILVTPSPPWMLLCTYRSELGPTSAPLADLRSAVSKPGGPCVFRELDVSELAPNEAAELARALLESRDPDVVALVTAEAGGNPLFLGELARWANHQGHANDAAGLSLEQVILDRVARLPEDARALLETLCVAGGPLTHAVAARATKVDSKLRAPALVLRGARLVVTRGLGDDDAIEPAHDRIRETVAHGLGAARRRACHAGIARALATERPVSDAVFGHFLAAGDLAGAKGVVVVAAAAAARALAFMRAATLYREAIRLEAGPRVDLHRRLGDALANAGRLGEAADAYFEGAQDAEPELALELRRLAAEAFLKSGRDARGLAVLRGVLASVGLPYPRSNASALASYVWHQAQLRVLPLRRRLRAAQSVSGADLARIDVAFSAATGLMLSDPLRAADFAARGLLLALDASEPVRLCRALAVASGNAALRGESGRARAEELVGAAERVARETDEPALRALAAIGAGTVHLYLGEWRAARVDLENADRILRESCRAVTWELANTQSWTCNVLILTGELREAAQRVPAMMEEARAREDRFAISYLVYPACISRLVADDAEGAREIARLGNAGDSRVMSSGGWGGFISACSVDRYRGEGAAAWRRVLAQMPALRRTMMWRSAMIRVFSLYEGGLSALAAASVGYDHRKALRAVQRWATELANEKLRYAPALGELLRAGACAVRGDRDGALDALGTALPRLDAADLGYLAACARHRKGELLGPMGRGLLADSRAFFESQGVVRPEKCLGMSAPGF